MYDQPVTSEFSLSIRGLYQLNRLGAYVHTYAYVLCIHIPRLHTFMLHDHFDPLIRPLIILCKGLETQTVTVRHKKYTELDFS